MNWMGLLGILLIAYAVAVTAIALKKPEKIWDMAKIRMFRKVLGERGTVVFFLIFAAVAAGAGVWLLVLSN